MCKAVQDWQKSLLDKDREEGKLIGAINALHSMNMSVREIAEKVGCTEENVRSVINSNTNS